MRPGRAIYGRPGFDDPLPPECAYLLHGGPQVTAEHVEQLDEAITFGESALDVIERSAGLAQIGPAHPLRYPQCHLQRLIAGWKRAKADCEAVLAMEKDDG